MKKELKKESESLKEIIKEVAGVNIMKTSRIRTYVDARMIYSKILRDRGYTLGSIGRTIMKDHTMIIHYLSNVDTFINTDKEMIEMYAMCCAKFYEIYSSDEEYNVFALQKKVAALTSRINELTLQQNSPPVIEPPYGRLNKIVEMINERTPKGKEDVVDRKINAIFNNGKI